MMRATMRAALALPDGVGVVLAALMLGYYRQHRVTGPALMLHLCDRGRKYGLRHYFYGSTPNIAARLTQQMGRRFAGMKIAGVYSPPFSSNPREEDELIERINKTRPDIVWVGLGCPKQEKWMLANVGRIDAPAMIGVGAAFDFHSGVMKWAPWWVRKAGMEWLFRLAMEPQRMWRRNVRGAQFVTLVVQEAMGRFLWPNVAGIAGALAEARPSLPKLSVWVKKVNRWFDEEMEAPAAPPVVRIGEPEPQMQTQKAA
jgi:N-acetylglucosaminyldiphosphoundecaprenol N-acetyl-beta-D-mannosaminyltransferase